MEHAADLIPANILLAMEPSEFEAVRQEFLNDLAAIMDVDASELFITEVRYHCSDVHLLIPESRGDILKMIINRDSDLPEGLRKQIANIRRKYKVMLVLSGAPYAKKKNYQYVPEAPDRAFTWLHISDAHFEAPHTGKKLDFWGQDRVTKAFVRDVTGLLAEEHLIPDCVFFTGDIAFSGHPDEYDIAITFTERLRHALPNGDDATFYFVPGNHDVTRDVVKQNQAHEQEALDYLKKSSKVEEYLGAPRFSEGRTRVFERLKNYFAFSGEASEYGQPFLNHDYYFTRCFPHKDLMIGVAGLNSAWRCGSDEDRGNLVLGIPQIESAIEDLENADVKIALMHHPPESDWFIVEDRLFQRNALPKFDFVLRGHEHDPDAKIRGFHAGREYCQISAGAIYSHDDFHKTFNVVQLDLDTGAAWVFFWRLSERTYSWIKDVELYSNGFHAFELPLSLLDRLSRTSSRTR